MIKVFFVKQNQEVLVKAGETVASACSRLGMPLDLTCGGKGICKKCQIVIEKNGKTEIVRACQEKIWTELIIHLEETNVYSNANILSETILTDFKIKPTINKIFVKKDLLHTPCCEGNWESILKIKQLRIDTPTLSLLQKLSTLMSRKGISGITLILWNQSLVEIEENDTTEQLYGLAIDLGTTSIVAYLYNLFTRTRMGTYSILNGQVSEGADVISRIAASIESSDNRLTLQSKAIDSVNQLIKQAVADQRLNEKNIYTIVISGNSAMQHLFLGLHPESLGKAPYINTIINEVVVKAGELRLNINPKGIIHFLPLIGGFVGADTTAVLLSLPKNETSTNKLIIDLGTNGEILLGNSNKWLTASTAAGPALEGVNIVFGMRGTSGAIERVKLTNGMVEIKIIGSEKPKGICGSGIIDAVAEMLKVGIITNDGKLLRAEEYSAICRPEYKNFVTCLKRIDNLNVFVLAGQHQPDDDGLIYISQKDIRSVQLAKSAIFTGCIILMKEYGLQAVDISEILLAGAFGNFIDVHNAQYIGLIPHFNKVPVKAIGNAAGTGTIKFLLSKELQKTTSKILKTVIHVDLASHTNFEKEYLLNTNFSDKSPA